MTKFNMCNKFHLLFRVTSSGRIIYHHASYHHMQ